jgi:release factor glutamine methyltransferase
LERPGLEILATDISADTLALAHDNAISHGVNDRIKFLQTDLLAAVDADLDFLVANLPYIPTAEIGQLSREVQHDPRLALDGGEDGLNVIRRLIRETPRHLKPGACMLLEIGVSQAPQVVDVLEQQKFRDICVEKDYQGIERFVSAKYG